MDLPQKYKKSRVDKKRTNLLFCAKRIIRKAIRTTNSVPGALHTGIYQLHVTQYANGLALFIGPRVSLVHPTESLIIHYKTNRSMRLIISSENMGTDNVTITAN